MRLPSTVRPVPSTPSTRGPDASSRPIDTRRRIRRQWALPAEANRFTIPAGRLTLLPGPLLAVAGLTFGPPEDTRERSTSSYYRGLHLALLLDVASGTWRTGVDAFEESCVAACHDTEITASSNTVVVTQPTTPRVGLYDKHLRLRRVVDVSSPRYLREREQLDTPLSQQAGTVWALTNSSVRSAWAVDEHLYTVHSLTLVDDDWAPGSALVQWRDFLNVHTAGGRPVALDRRLAGYYQGHSRSHVVTADYGAGGRQRSAPAVDIVLTRLPVE